jgi:hypothetical protein
MMLFIDDTGTGGNATGMAGNATGMAGNATGMAGNGTSPMQLPVAKTSVHHEWRIGTWVRYSRSLLSFRSIRSDHFQVFLCATMAVVIIRLALRMLWMRKYQADDMLLLLVLVSIPFLQYEVKFTLIP